jgi:hypothetical protein
LNSASAPHSNVAGEDVFNVQFRRYHRREGWHEVIGCGIARREDSADLRKFNASVFKRVQRCVARQRYEVLAGPHAVQFGNSREVRYGSWIAFEMVFEALSSDDG